MKFHGRQIPVFDMHADSLGAALSGRPLGRWNSAGQWDFPRRASLGSGVQVFSCWVEPDFKPERALSRLLTYIDAFWTEMGNASAWVFPVTNLPALRSVYQEPRRVGAMLSVEGAEAVGTDPSRVRILARLGVRIMSLTWNERNALADGAGEEPGAGGISRAGRQIVQEMMSQGLLVDVSHLARAGFWDILEFATSGRVLATHSNCDALAPHARNLNDDQIRGLIRHGGIQGITFVPAFLSGARNLDRVIDHCLHHLAIVGDDVHLALGSDFDGVEEPVIGLEDVTQLPALAERMSERGLVDDTIERILGTNLLQYFERMWETASFPFVWQMASTQRQEENHGNPSS